MKNKLISAPEAVKLIQKGDTVMVGGFLKCGTPTKVIEAILESDVDNLTLIANDTCFVDSDRGLLVTHKKLKKVNILIMLILLIFLIINYQGTIYAFIQIFNSIVRAYNKNVGINIATINIYIDKDTIFSHVFMFTIFIQYLISNIIMKFMMKEKYGKTFIFTLIIALPIILVQIPIDWTSWVLLITYWFLLYVCYYFRNAINQNKLFKLAILILSILSLTTALFINNFSETKLKKYYNPATLQQEMFDRFNDWLQKISNIQL